MAESYDAIVIGARCGGSPTAMLLARKGYRVLLVDRATFPSDTVSTHFIHAPGMAALERWGLRDTLAASGCPSVRTYSFDFGPFTIAGSPRPSDGIDEAHCPRRPVLDTMLLHAAAHAGADVREGFTVDEVLIEDGTVIGVRGKAAGGATVTEHANVVIGADGRNSSVAKAVNPEQYNEKPAVTPAFYSYWSDVGDAGYHLHPITAQGITDAFLDAERLTDALDATFTGRSSYDDAMTAYQLARDEATMPMYAMTFDFAQVDQPVPPQTQQLLGAVAGNQQAMDDFSVQAGTLPIPEFFSPENIGRIVAAQDQLA